MRLKKESPALALGMVLLFPSACTWPAGRIADGTQSTAWRTWREEAAVYRLTPQTDRVFPAAVVRTEAAVENASALLAEDGRSCRLRFPAGGKKPVAILDFGKSSVGGYAVFTVTAQTGLPVVRIAYACHPDGLSETGCFTRETSARYLGPTFDLPILPANVNRHECYTIPRTGRFIAPLIQGQTRYVRVQLDTPGTSVDIDSVAMVNSGVYDRSPADGLFLCSDERLNQLWAISVWTLQIASFPNHDAWKTVDGWLLPRKLEQAADVGLSATGAAWRDVTLRTTFELRANPHFVSGAGVAFRARDPANAYLADVALDGRVRLLRREAGRDTVLAERQLTAPLTDGARYELTVSAKGPVLSVNLDGRPVLEARDGRWTAGRIGFYTPKEKWPLFDAVRVTDGSGKLLLADDFSGDLSKWQFARTLPYVADGAKRDRLVWSGDLYWAERNRFYAFAAPTYLRGSLKMLAFNQTPEGYVQASPYPERSVPPASGEYGPFPSDEFAAWLVPVAWDYLLYTDDIAALREIYPAIRRLLTYLRRHTGPDGLYVQRPETSKHAGNLKPGDVRTRAYMNILLWGAFSDAARIAEQLGHGADAEADRQHAASIRRALFAKLWDERSGSFKEAVETPSFGAEANALALSMDLVSREQALRIAPQFKRIGHGKFQSLVSRGKFEYGFSQSALQTLFDHNWLKLLDPSWKGAWTTTECMGMIRRGWGDESHPDTAIAALFSAYLLGVQPVEPGYRRFRVRPQPVRGVTWAKGLVPTPHGLIAVEWCHAEETFSVALTVPKGCVADVALPVCRRVLVNGKPGAADALRAGVYRIEACGLAPGAFADPLQKDAARAGRLPVRVTTSSSHEAGGWGKANLFAPESDTTRKGYSSEAHPAAAAAEWIEIDLGEPTPVSKLVLLPRRDQTAAGGGVADFPVDFTVSLTQESGKDPVVRRFTGCPAPGAAGFEIDFYTVIGCPQARTIRIDVSRLGQPARDEPGHYRFQLSRIRVITP